MFFHARIENLTELKTRFIVKDRGGDGLVLCVLLHCQSRRSRPIYFTVPGCVLFCSRSIRGLAAPWTYFLYMYLSLSSAILIDSSVVSPVHVLMLSIHAVHGLPHLHAPGIVPQCCSDHSIISMSASLLWQSLIVSSLLQLCWWPTHLFSSLSTKLAVSSSVLSSQRRQYVFRHSV